MATACAVAAEDNIIFDEECHRLTAKQREVVALLFCGYKQREIAAMLGVRRSSVAMRLLRARKRYRFRDKA